MYFNLPHGHLCATMLVEQKKGRKSIPMKTTVKSWCLPWTVVRGEAVTSSLPLAVWLKMSRFSYKRASYSRKKRASKSSI